MTVVWSTAMKEPAVSLASRVPVQNLCVPALSQYDYKFWMQYGAYVTDRRQTY
jgi:hypothetical protein